MRAGTSSCWGSHPASFWGVGREQLRDSSQGRAHCSVNQHRDTAEWVLPRYGEMLLQLDNYPDAINSPWRCYQGILALCCVSTSAAAHSLSSDTQQIHTGPRWIPRQLLLLPREYLTARCWVHLGLEHLPTFSGKVSYCAEKLPSYVRPREVVGKCWREFMQCASPWFGQVLESYFCYVWILSCDSFPLLAPGLGLAWLHHVLQLLVCWTFRAETRSSTVKSVQSCASAAQLPLSAQPCWQSYTTLSSTTTLFSAYIKTFPLFFSSKLRHS